MSRFYELFRYMGWKNTSAICFGMDYTILHSGNLTLVLLDPDIYVFKKVSTQINATEIDKKLSGRCSANQIFHFGRCLFFINSHIFRHLKLEIALAMPALNE